MAWFRKKSDIIDLTKDKIPPQLIRRNNYKISKGGYVEFIPDKKENTPLSSSSNVNSSSYPFGFLDSPSSGNSSSSDFSNSFSNNPVTQVSEISELKHKMREITGRIEDSSNELYRLLHRIELLERKIERLEGRG